MSRRIKLSNNDYIDASSVLVGNLDLAHSLLPIKGIIPKNTDIDNLDVGIWYSGDYANKASLIHYPDSGSLGTIIVFHSFNYTTNLPHQVFINSYNNDLLGFRHKEDINYKWTEWKYLVP